MNTEQAALAARVKAVIEDHPSRHFQGSWFGNEFDANWENAAVDVLRPYLDTDVPDAPADWGNPVCGTTACAAGIAALLDAPAGSVAVEHGTLLIPDPEGTAVGQDKDGQVLRYRREDVRVYAQNALGLSTRQQMYLFSGYRTRDEVLCALDYLPLHPGAKITDLIRECGDEFGEYAGQMDFFRATEESR